MQFSCMIFNLKLLSWQGLISSLMSWPCFAFIIRKLKKGHKRFIHKFCMKWVHANQSCKRETEQRQGGGGAGKKEAGWSRKQPHCAVRSLGKLENDEACPSQFQAWSRALRLILGSQSVVNEGVNLFFWEMWIWKEENLGFVTNEYSKM